LEQGDWITMASLGTFGGAVFAVTLICQFLKEPVDRILKLPTRLLALVAAWVVLLGRRFVMDGAMPPDGLFLDFLNGFLVALAAMGAHSVARDNLRWK
jgi:hypothetical protein